jgi:hypothetical protein
VRPDCEVTNLNLTRKGGKGEVGIRRGAGPQGVERVVEPEGLKVRSYQKGLSLYAERLRSRGAQNDHALHFASSLSYNTSNK